MPALISFARSSTWQTGFVGNVTIRADAPISGWTMVFEAPFAIVNIWGADIVARQDGKYLIRAATWNANAPAGGTLSFGFQASTNGAAPDPSGFVLGGPNDLAFPPPPPPTISISDASAVEGGFAVFTVNLSKPATEAVTVGFQASSGSAAIGQDLPARQGEITFAPGETSRQIRVATTDDTLREAPETFLLSLSNARGAEILRGVGTGTIADNDWPRISIADASVLEVNSNQTAIRFQVTLSAPQAEAVSVRFETADGTAIAGSDYTARSSTLWFAPGETAKHITVAALGDRVVEADETFLVRLSAPRNAVIEDGEAIGTIRNNDLPRITIADAAAVTEADPSEGLMIGALSTRGNQIIDATGAPVRIAAVNWFGMETTTQAPHGLHLRNWQDMMDQMKEEGFNAVRLPFSGQSILDPGAPGGINFALNPDLVGLKPIEIMDRIIDYAGEIGLRIILDHHRSGAGNGPNPNGLWYDHGYPEARWIRMWEDLALRYKGDPTVIGADLQNEPHGATWYRWADAAERAGNAVLRVNPDWLIFVEGVGSHGGEHYWWGGQLQGVRDRPVQLEVANKLVYSPHDYPNSVYPQPFFYTADFPNNLPAIFDENWGFIWREGIAPVFVGEMGSRLSDPRDIAWMQKLTAYMSGDLDANGTRDRADLGPSFAWWSWNPNSGDTGGILADDWTTVQTRKLDALAPLMPDGDAGPVQAIFEVRLSTAAFVPVSVNWRTAPHTAGEADYVAAGGTLTFAPGETVQRIAVTVTPDELREREETFRVELSAPSGVVIADAIGIGRILDDDGASVMRVGSDWVL